MPEDDTVTRIVVFRGEDTNWWWRAKSGRTRILYESREGYLTTDSAIASAKDMFPTITPEVGDE